MCDVMVEPCPTCNGEGRDIRTGTVYEAGCGHPHLGEVDHGPCQTCDGTGSVDTEIELVTLEDLENADAEESS